VAHGGRRCYSTTAVGPCHRPPRRQMYSFANFFANHIFLQNWYEKCKKKKKKILSPSSRTISNNEGHTQNTSRTVELHIKKLLQQTIQTGYAILHRTLDGMQICILRREYANPPRRVRWAPYQCSTGRGSIERMTRLDCWRSKVLGLLVLLCNTYIKKWVSYLGANGWRQSQTLKQEEGHAWNCELNAGKLAGDKCARGRTDKNDSNYHPHVATLCPPPAIAEPRTWAHVSVSRRRLII
jgi:hypothetical protein